MFSSPTYTFKSKLYTYVNATPVSIHEKSEMRATSNEHRHTNGQHNQKFESTACIVN